MILRQQIQLPNTFQFDMQAKNSQRAYRIFVSYPNAPAPEDGYPVIFHLDGNATYLSFAEAVRLQTRAPHGFDAALVVGIGFQTDEPFDHDQRYLNYTSPADIANLPVRPEGVTWPEFGGCDAFLDFIENDLKPLIAEEFSVNLDRSTLFGHSLGGFFALHTLITRPDSFACFCAGSASIWWDDGMLIELVKQLPQNLKTFKANPRVLLGVGSDELEHMVADSENMAATLSAMTNTVLFKIEGEEHISVLPAFISRTIAFALSTDGKRPPRTRSSPGQQALDKRAARAS